MYILYISFSWSSHKCVCFFFEVVIIIVLTESVHRHMQQYEVEYLQFAFRWMNNLLMRELPLRCTIRLWDTYQVQTHTHTQQSYRCCSFCYLSISIFLALIMTSMIASEVVLL